MDHRNRRVPYTVQVKAASPRNVRKSPPSADINVFQVLAIFGVLWVMGIVGACTIAGPDSPTAIYHVMIEE